MIRETGAKDLHVVAVVDDDDSVRGALLRLISGKGYQVATFASAKDFLAHEHQSDFSCIVSDLKMPEFDGIELQKKLSASLPHLSFVFITGHGDVPSSVEAMKSGAVDFLEKPVTPTVLLNAIERAMDRTRAFRQAQGELETFRASYGQLTARERQVFALVTTGLLNKQIAAELGTAEKTIKYHRARVMEKMNAESLADLVLMADRLGVRSNVDLSRARGKLIS
jgi:FixJ family two-component response regulator